MKIKQQYNFASIICHHKQSFDSYQLFFLISSRIETRKNYVFFPFFPESLLQERYNFLQVQYIFNAHVTTCLLSMIKNNMIINTPS